MKNISKAVIKAELRKKSIASMKKLRKLKCNKLQ